MIRVLVADDEPLAREALTKLIERDSEFKVVAQAQNGKDGLKKLETHKVDIAFLDIEMPELTGLEAASQLACWQEAPLIVFVTAYHQFAIEAFEANAVDYVLKPVDPARLTKTLERLRERLKSSKLRKQNLTGLESDLIRKGILKKIVGRRRKSKDKILLEPLDVHYFHVHYTEILAVLEEEELVVSETLKELLARLDPNTFAQTHKSFIVNLNQIQKVSPMFSGNFEITLKHPAKPKIPLSRRYVPKLKSLLGSW